MGFPDRAGRFFSSAASHTMLGVRSDRAARGLKANWLVLASLPALYSTEIVFDVMYTRPVLLASFNVFLALACGALLCACLPPWTEAREGLPAWARVFSLLSAIGLTCARMGIARSNLLWLAGKLWGGAVSAVLSAFVSAGCLFAMYVLCLYLARGVSDVLARAGFAPEGAELAVLAGCVFACGAACAAFCLGTELTYTKVPMYDAVYQFDNSAVIYDMTHAWFSSAGNGVHQPLFGVFAAPFAGIPYLLSAVSGNPAKAFAIAEPFAQAAGIMLGSSFLGYAIGLSRRARICWTLLAGSSFSYFLFSLCVEQYACGFFYIALLVLASSCSGRPGKFPVYAAAGSMALSAVAAVPALRSRRGIRQAAARLAGMAVDAVVIMCAAMRAPWPGWIFGSGMDMLTYTSAVGGGRDPAGQVRQWLSMLSSVLAAPLSGPMDISAILDGKDALYPEAAGLEVWGQAPDAGVPVLGIVLAAGAFLGLYACRKELWARMAGCHLVLGLFMVCVLGLGAADGNPVLYSLYFGWPAPCLIAGGLSKLLGAARIPAWGLPAATAAGCAALLACNVPAALGMFRFGARCYPAF